MRYNSVNYSSSSLIAENPGYGHAVGVRTSSFRELDDGLWVDIRPNLLAIVAIRRGLKEPVKI